MAADLWIARGLILLGLLPFAADGAYHEISLRGFAITHFSSDHKGDGDGGELHVLAVDDSVVERMFLERMLKNSEYKVTTAENGARALEYLGLVGCVEDGAQNKPDLKVNLIITDYCMPGMTGFELMKKIKEISYLKEIPVVIMSSENIPTRIEKCLEEGAKDFMLKPIQQSDVKRLRCHVKSFNQSSPGRLSMGETKRLLL